MRGFTILELLLGIFLISVISVTLLAPGLVSVKRFAAGGGAIHSQTGLYLQGLADQFTQQTSGLDADSWAFQMSLMASASPERITPDPAFNGARYRVTRIVECLKQDLTAPDTSCRDGYGRVTYSVAGADNAAIDLIFIKTRNGI